MAAIIFLIPGIAIGAAYDGSACRANGGTLKRTAGLVANNSAQKSAAERTGGGPALSVRSGRSGTAGKNDRYGSTCNG